MNTPLGAGPEFDRIRSIAKELAAHAGDLGDDAAVVPDGDGSLVISTDASVEDVHFRREWLSLEEIGWRATAAALSDLAAMGARPVGVLAALAVPASAPAGDPALVMRGVGAAASSTGASVIGGDLTSAASWVVTVTVIGRTGRPVRRRGARPGDTLWVTGALGGARAALTAWQHGGKPAAAARAAFAHPEPRIEAGRWLAEHGAHAMLDLSDGLAADARHLAAASGVRVDIDLSRVPVAGAAVPASLALSLEPSLFAAQGGEDYELLAALPDRFGEPEIRAFEVATGLALTQVGTAHRGSGVRFMLRGERVSLEGFDHFR
ncbi:MAG TPA: thiamine-phosphate kinase [Gemmatimonadales bacterium]|nr:thiamine-phosphate kinase [Gemmatimonadales bacterium]